MKSELNIDFINYFNRTWVTVYPPTTWSTFYMYNEMKNLNTNNILERFFKSMKVSLPSPPPTIDLAVNHLYNLMLLRSKERVVCANRQKLWKRNSLELPSPVFDNLGVVSRPMDDLLYRIKKNCKNFIIKYHGLAASNSKH
jgi:hypothetical protein